MSEQILGMYDYTIFRNEETGKSIFTLRVSDKIEGRDRYGCIKCSGFTPAYSKGIPLSLLGNMEQTKYGKQFSFTSVRENSFSEAAAIEYLASPCFKSVGIAIARELVSRFGHDFFSYVRENPNAANDFARRVRKLGQKPASMLCQTIRNTVAQREIFEYIYPYGGKWPQVPKLIELYGYMAIQRLKAEPYDAGMACGLDFYTCDRIAKDNGVKPHSPQRVSAVVKTGLQKFTGKGNVYAPQNEACQACHSLVRKSSFPQPLPSSLLVSEMVKNPSIIIEEDVRNRVYTKRLLQAEQNTAAQLGRLLSSRRSLCISNELIEQIEKLCNIRYSPRQRDCFLLAKEGGVVVITGGPGTGKTSCVKGLAMAIKKERPEASIAMCAPTGRAAQRLSESTGSEGAMTVHRLLEYKPYGGSVSHKNQDDPLQVDVLIVDEVSMLGIHMASILLSAIRSGTLVIFIGDEDQLSSVEPGDFLHDLIHSGAVPVVRLTDVYRQAMLSTIVLNARRINEGDTELVTDDSFGIQYFEYPRDIGAEIAELAAQHYDRNDPFAFQVLAPYYDGDAGVLALNKQLQQKLNPASSGRELRYGERKFRVGDKVILTRNNYDICYFNGDIGIVRDITEEKIDIVTMGRRLSLGRKHLEDVDLAYCISVHKSQGSEFSNVAIALPDGGTRRNVLYTGVTRAKDRVWVAAQYGALYKAINNSDYGTRYSHLIPRVNTQLELAA